MTDITTLATDLGREAAAKVRTFTQTNDVAKKAKDALYTVVGLGVLSAQKLNVAAKQVQAKVETSIDGDVKRQAAKANAKINQLIDGVETLVAPYEEKLPQVARDASAKLRDVTGTVRAKVTNALSDETPATTTSVQPEASEEVA